jgi:GNAT superfamily N-acetyltransferase
LLRTSLWTVAAATLCMGLTTDFSAWVALRFVAGLAGAGAFVLTSAVMLEELSRRGGNRGWRASLSRRVCGNEILGHAMYARDEESNHETEFAIIFEDERQARGLGTILLAEIAEEARRGGIEVITGVVLAKNRRVLSLVRRVLPGFLSSCRTGTCAFCAPLTVPLIEARPEGE